MLHSNKIILHGLQQFKIHIRISNSSSESIMRGSSSIVKSTHTNACSSQMFATSRVSSGQFPLNCV